MTTGHSSGADGVDARRLALEALARVEDDGAFANIVLSGLLTKSGLDQQDRGFVTDLVYGTLRRQRSCDHLVDRFLTSDPPASARRALRLGAYQLAFRGDIPSYAAVSSTVDATPKRFRGLVNAVLRRVSTAPVEFPDEATRLSYPDWIVELLKRDLGSMNAIEALEEMNKAAQATVREDGYTQDLASQMVVDLIDARGDDVVLDLCAAPGGKATGIAASGATVVASDLQGHRVRLITSNITSLALDNVFPLVADGLKAPFRPESADFVLLDAPCSGLGVLRRRADARWNIDPEAPDRLSLLQKQLVDSAVSLLKPGGVFIYSICTLTAVETTGVDAYIAEKHPRLEPLSCPDVPWEPWGRGAILLPQRLSTDGMCVFRYRYN